MAEDIVEFWVPGIPAPAGSKRAFYIEKLKRAVITDDCKRSKPWQADVKHFAFSAMNGQPALEGPVRLEAVFRMPRPKGHYGTRQGQSRLHDWAPMHPTSKPDATKLLRAIEDAMTGIVWKDDAQVVHQTVEKLYGERPGVLIRVMKIAAPIAPNSPPPQLPLMETTHVGS